MKCPAFRRLIPQAVVFACIVLSASGAAEAAPRVVELKPLGPGSGSGLVFVDALQQATPWTAVGEAASLSLDSMGNLRELVAGQSAERVVYTNERYPAGDYTLEWSGRATFAVSGGTLLPGGGPNALVLRVGANDGSGLRLRVTATDPEHPVRDVRLFLPGARATAASPTFVPAFVRSVDGADVIRFAQWARSESFAGPAVWPLRPTLERPTQAMSDGAAFEDEILLANLTGAHPWFSIPAGATDGYVRGAARVVLRTLDPSLRPVLEYADREMLVPGTPTNRWAVMAARNTGLSTDAQTGARAWYARRSAQVLAIFRQVFAGQAGRIVPADSVEFATLHRARGNPNATLAPGDDVYPVQNEHVPATLPVFRPGVPGASHARGAFDLAGRPGVAIGLGVPLAGPSSARDGALNAAAKHGSAYAVDVPADTTERTLRVYVTASGTRAVLGAMLDGKAYLADSVGNGSQTRTGVWTIVYRSAHGGSRLRLRVTSETGRGTLSVAYTSPAARDLRGTRNASPSDEALYHNDLLRTGWNPNETALTAANVNASSFGQVGTLAVDGAVLAQPLYLAGVTIGGATHNVLLVATENASVYEFDADTGAQLNRVSLGTAASSKTIGCSDIVPSYGVTATPVVDRTTNTIYVVAVTEPEKRQFHVTLHALNLLTLADAATPRRPEPLRHAEQRRQGRLRSAEPTRARRARLGQRHALRRRGLALRQQRRRHRRLDAGVRRESQPTRRLSDHRGRRGLSALERVAERLRTGRLGRGRRLLRHR